MLGKSIVHIPFRSSNPTRLLSHGARQTWRFPYGAFVALSIASKHTSYTPFIHFSQRQPCPNPKPVPSEPKLPLSRDIVPYGPSIPQPGEPFQLYGGKKPRSLISVKPKPPGSCSDEPVPSLPRDYLYQSAGCRVEQGDQNSCRNR